MIVYSIVFEYFNYIFKSQYCEFRYLNVKYFDTVELQFDFRKNAVIRFKLFYYTDFPILTAHLN